MIKKEDLVSFILEQVNNNPIITEKELASLSNYSERSIRRYVKMLKDGKKIILVKGKKRRYWKILI